LSWLTPMNTAATAVIAVITAEAPPTRAQNSTEPMIRCQVRDGASTEISTRWSGSAIASLRLSSPASRASPSMCAPRASWEM